MAFEAEINLADIDGSSDGFEILTNNEYDNGTPRAGDSYLRSVSAAGDVNGDGFDDVIIGVPRLYGDRSGGSFVVFGAENSSRLLLSELNGNNGFALYSGSYSTGYDRVGFSVSDAGDINGDGFGDVVVGASSQRFSNARGANETYVVFGSAAAFDPSLTVSDLNGEDGFTLRTEQLNNVGYSVSSAGDINNDGIDDLIVGSYEGKSYVVFGTTEGFGSNFNLSALDGTNGFVIQDEVITERNTEPGYAVSGTDDVNGDGIDDLIIGAPARGTSIFDYGDRTGESYVIFGSNSEFDSTLELSTLDGSNGFVINGIDVGENSFEISNRSDNFGQSVSSAGDINGDGLNDLIIGASYADPEVSPESRIGASYVVFGSSAGFSSLDVADLDGNNGFVIGGLAEGDRTGYSVSGVNDINGDGIDDLIIGAPGFSYGYNFSDRIGKSYLLFGSTDGFSRNFELSSLDGENGFVITGIEEGDRTGLSVSGAGDVNNDGTNDVIVGAGNGNSYIIYGRPSTSVQFKPEVINPLNPVTEGTAGDDGITGTRESDRIEGLAGNDVLNGAAGDDRLDGGEGTDTALYQFDSAGVIVDLIAGTATDGFSNTDTLVSIENIIGSDFADTVKGDSENNNLTGRSGNDTLEGGLGADTLLGGEGSDMLIGGSGADSFLYLSSTEIGDTISTFESGNDKLLISSAGFGGGLSRGVLSAERFFTGAGSTTASHRLGYDASTGNILFDVDGLRGADALVLATLSNPEPNFNASDVNVI